MDQPTACRVVDGLVRRRLLRSRPDPADRRRSRLALTPAGKALAEELLPLAAEVRRAVERSLSAGERRAVVSGLTKVIASQDAFEATLSGGPLAPARPPSRVA